MVGAVRTAVQRQGPVVGVGARLAVIAVLVHLASGSSQGVPDLLLRVTLRRGRRALLGVVRAPLISPMVMRVPSRFLVAAVVAVMPVLSLRGSVRFVGLGMRGSRGSVWRLFLSGRLTSHLSRARALTLVRALDVGVVCRLEGWPFMAVPALLLARGHLGRLPGLRRSGARRAFVRGRGPLSDDDGKLGRIRRLRRAPIKGRKRRHGESAGQDVCDGIYRMRLVREIHDEG